MLHRIDFFQLMPPYVFKEVKSSGNGNVYVVYLKRGEVKPKGVVSSIFMGEKLCVKAN